MVVVALKFTHLIYKVKLNCTSALGATPVLHGSKSSVATTTTKSAAKKCTRMVSTCGLVPALKGMNRYASMAEEPITVAEDIAPLSHPTA